MPTALIQRSLDGALSPSPQCPEVCEARLNAREHYRPNELRIDRPYDRLPAPRAVDGSGLRLRRSPDQQAFCADHVAAGKFARVFSRVSSKVVFEADGTGLVFDMVGMEDLGRVEESFEVDGHW